mmetsp:Transcript_17615/g.34650  ORF Transcript_17615/g.34650 Transcript_17615/m.34650 type:complete len:247 (-) Transcript_17615:20-760(-)
MCLCKGREPRQWRQATRLYVIILFLHQLVPGNLRDLMKCDDNRVRLALVRNLANLTMQLGQHEFVVLAVIHIFQVDGQRRFGPVEIHIVVRRLSSGKKIIRRHVNLDSLLAISPAVALNNVFQLFDRYLVYGLARVNTGRFAAVVLDSLARRSVSVVVSVLTLAADVLLEGILCRAVVLLLICGRRSARNSVIASVLHGKGREVLARERGFSSVTLDLRHRVCSRQITLQTSQQEWDVNAIPPWLL